MRRLASRVLIVGLLAALVSAVPGTAAHAADAPVVALGFMSPGWSYKQVPYDAEPGFEAPAYDASAWAVGQAGFGTTDGVCPWNNTDQVHRPWDPGTDMLLRHQLTLPPGASGVHISGTVDNNADVYVNGTPVQHVDNGFCTADGINADVPETAISQDNVLAIRARDLGQATFIDVQVTFLGGGSGGRYVALGDSYASGEGADESDFLNGTSFPDPDTSLRSTTGCHRSRTSWANAVFSRAKDSGLADDFIFVACSGAVADNLFGSNASYQRVGEVEPPQLGSVTRETNLATLSIGGNDVGFRKILEDCSDYIRHAGFGCRKLGRKARTAADDGLAKLANGLDIPSQGTSYSLSYIYAAVVREMAAAGTLIVTGYPRLFAESRFGYDWNGIARGGWVCQVGTGNALFRVLISYDDAQWINDVVDRGNNIISDSVAAANAYLQQTGSNAKVIYVSSSPSFTNHRLCSGDKWFNGLQLTSSREPKQTSFHPNKEGQDAYASAVLPAVPS